MIFYNFVLCLYLSVNGTSWYVEILSLFLLKDSFYQINAVDKVCRVTVLTLLHADLTKHCSYLYFLIQTWTK